jgi:predicted lipoprotein
MSRTSAERKGPVAGSAARGWRVLAALGGLCAVKVACTGPAPSPEAVSPEVRAVLSDTWPAVVSPTLARVAEGTVALEEAARAWERAAASGADDAAARAEAQAAWQVVMEAWQEAEVLQVGPAGASLTVAGGMDLRDRIYSWPTVNHCRVDQETVAGAWDTEAFADTRLVTVLGLDALEVLLYAPPGENACPAQVDLNASGAWESLGVDGVQAARASYARALAVTLHRDVAALISAWEPAEGNFAGTLADAGSGDGPYESGRAAVNALFDALFYLEGVTKDQKLGYALGNGDCTGGGDTCLSQVEGTLAGGSHRWVAANLRGFRALFTGGGASGQGLEDLLRHDGEAELADRVLAALDAADAAAAALDASLPEAVAAERAAVETLQARIDAVCDLLRLDVAALLALEIPDEAAGDND